MLLSYLNVIHFPIYFPAFLYANKITRNTFHFCIDCFNSIDANYATILHLSDNNFVAVIFI